MESQANAAGSIHPLLSIFLKQSAMEKDMLEQQLELQRQQMQQQLKQQREHMERQVELLRTHIGNKDLLPNSQRLANGLFTESISDQQPPDDDLDTAKRELKLVDEVCKRTDGRAEQWKRCSGLHTVRDWVMNYRKHPAGWGALLMIHGIPEVTGRLRTKVSNYASFSALFLALAIHGLSHGVTEVCKSDEGTWQCAVRRRVFTYSIFLSMTSLVLAILLAMAFQDALNEAARDSDIFRMFARGSGYRATVKVQLAFRIGLAAFGAADVALVQELMGWEIVGWVAALFVGLCWIYAWTVRPLFANASIVGYWREELGGKPDEDDPYDLAVPAHCFDERAKVGKKLGLAAMEENGYKPLLSSV